jgi:hypothetical protein
LAAAKDADRDVIDHFEPPSSQMKVDPLNKLIDGYCDLRRLFLPQHYALLRPSTNPTKHFTLSAAFRRQASRKAQKRNAFRFCRL